MLSLIPFITYAACTAYFFGVLNVMLAAWDAPIGYEDEEGFHYGIKVDAGADQ